MRAETGLELWPLVAHLGKPSPVRASSSHRGHLSIVFFDIKVLMLLNLTSLWFCSEVRTSWGGASGDASRWRSGRRTCDPLGYQSQAPAPGSRDHTVCQESTGRTVQGSGAQCCAHGAGPPPPCFRVPSQGPQLRPGWSQHQGSGHSTTGEVTAPRGRWWLLLRSHALLARGHWGAPTALHLVVLESRWGVSVPCGRPGRLLVTAILVPEPFWVPLPEAERAAGPGEEPRASQPGSNPAGPVPWSGGRVQPSSLGRRPHVRQVE